MISKVSVHESGGGQRVPSVFLTVSFARKACFSKVLARFLGNRQKRIFVASAFCAKGLFYNGFGTFCGGTFFWQVNPEER